MRIACWQTILMIIIPYFFLKLGKMSQNLSSAVVMIGALRVKIPSVVPRARHCGILAILPPMSLKNAPSAGLRAHLENLLNIFRCFLLFPYLV